MCTCTDQLVKKDEIHGTDSSKEYKVYLFSRSVRIHRPITATASVPNKTKPNRNEPDQQLILF